MHSAHLQLSRHLHLGCPEPRAPSGLLAIASAEGSRSELDTLRRRGEGNSALLHPAGAARTPDRIRARSGGLGPGPFPDVPRPASRPGPQPALDVLQEAPPDRDPSRIPATADDSLPVGGDTQQQGPFGVRHSRRPPQGPPQPRPGHHSLVEVPDRVDGRNTGGALLDSPEGRATACHRARQPFGTMGRTTPEDDLEQPVGMHALSSACEGNPTAACECDWTRAHRRGRRVRAMIVLVVLLLIPVAMLVAGYLELSE